jgi:hypothetical protein
MSDRCSGKASFSVTMTNPERHQTSRRATGLRLVARRAGTSDVRSEGWARAEAMCASGRVPAP